MSLSTVLANLRFTALEGTTFPSDHEALIRQAVELIYTNAPNSGRAMLESSVMKGELEFRYRPAEGNGAVIGQNIVFYDQTEISELNIIREDGSTQEMSLIRAITHELVHAVLGLNDPALPDYHTPGLDYVGDTVERENEILNELGAPGDRVSYTGVLSDEVFAAIGKTSGTSLSNGNNIGLAIVDGYTTSYDHIDISDRTDSAVLIGDRGDDLIIGGQAADYIYGGEQDDILGGSGGIDYLYGNDGADMLVGGSGAPIDSSSLNLNNPHPDWDDNVRDFLSGGAGADTYLLYSDRTYFGGPDSWDYVVNVFNSEIDFIDGSDADFDAYFQFEFGGETKTAHMTAADLQNATLVEWTDGLYDLGVEVTYSWGGEEVTQTIKGDLLDTGMLLLRIAFPGSEQFAILGGIYNFTPPSPQNVQSPQNLDDQARSKDAGADMFVFNKTSASAPGEFGTIHTAYLQSAIPDGSASDFSAADAEGDVFGPLSAGSFQDRDFLFAA
jgi:hypothetical protein